MRTRGGHRTQNIEQMGKSGTRYQGSAQARGGKPQRALVGEKLSSLLLF